MYIIRLNMVIRVHFDEDLVSTEIESEVTFWIRDDINPDSTHSIVIGRQGLIVEFVSNNNKISSMKIVFEEGDLSKRASRALRSLRNLESYEYKIIDEKERKFLRDLNENHAKDYSDDYKQTHKRRIMDKRNLLTNELSLINSVMDKLESL